jgi:hypothetical protein
MGKKPLHFPRTQVKIGYTLEAIYLMFKVADRYVISKHRTDQSDVYKDSCVEFFFTPGADISRGYFNLEINCTGNLLFHFQTRPRKEKVIVSREDCAAIERSTSMPGGKVPESQPPITWYAGCRIPFELLEKYTSITRPSPGITWQGNFHKCADLSSHPHWLTWSQIHHPVPDFHRPRDFGILRFAPMP